MSSSMRRRIGRPFTGGGVYLLGSCFFDIEAKEIHYYLKVGRTGDFVDRKKKYSTYNPEYYKIDKRVMCTERRKNGSLIDDGSPQEEKRYHKILSTFGENDGTEWYRVNEEYFLKIYNGGFRVLDEIEKEM